MQRKYSYNRLEVSRRKEAGLKYCWKCQSEKPFIAFARSKSRSDGLDPVCRKCTASKRQEPKARQRARSQQKARRHVKRGEYNADCRLRYTMNLSRERARGKKYREKHVIEIREKSRERREKNREKANAASREAKRARRAITKEDDRLYREKNKDRIREQAKLYRSQNGEKIRKKNAAYIQANRGKVNARTAQRTAAKLRATPPWIDLRAIEAIYIEAARLTLDTGIPHEVDHYYPLQGKTSCGLHVPLNLKISTRSLNRSKGNKMPEEEHHAAA